MFLGTTVAFCYVRLWATCSERKEGHVPPSRDFLFYFDCPISIQVKNGWFVVSALMGAGLIILGQTTHHSNCFYICPYECTVQLLYLWTTADATYALANARRELALASCSATFYPPATDGPNHKKIIEVVLRRFGSKSMYALVQVYSTWRVLEG